jgi:hypothetical protein
MNFRFHLFLEHSRLSRNSLDNRMYDTHLLSIDRATREDNAQIFPSEGIS